MLLIKECIYDIIKILIGFNDFQEIEETEMRVRTPPKQHSPLKRPRRESHDVRNGCLAYAKLNNKPQLSCTNRTNSSEKENLSTKHFGAVKSPQVNADTLLRSAFNLKNTFDKSVKLLKNGKKSHGLSEKIGEISSMTYTIRNNFLKIFKAVYDQQLEIIELYEESSSLHSEAY